MKCVNKCGEVVISADFVLANPDHIEINCYFCTDSFKSLQSFGGHLRNIHKWFLETLSTYYPKADELDDSSDSWLNFHNEANEQETEIPEIPKQDLDASETSRNEVENYEEPISVAGNDAVSTDNDDEESCETDADWEPSCSEAEQQQQQKAGAKAKNLNRTESSVKTRSRFTSSIVKEEAIVELVEQLEKYPVLWKYRCHEDMRSEWDSSINEILMHLKEKFPLETVTKLFIIRKIKSLKRLYNRAESGKIPTSSVPYYERLSFLKDQTRNKKDKLVIEKNSAGRFLCSLCPKDFLTEANTMKHMRTHRPEYRFKCEVCERAFFFQNELRSHMFIHTKEKPFICEICGQSFRISAKLKRHIKIHLQQKDYKCQLCPKTYTRRQYLNDHMNMHLNFKPAECETCGKRFYSKDLLRHHVKLHSDEKKYKCTICDMAFAQASGRASHMRRNHKIL